MNEKKVPLSNTRIVIILLGTLVWLTSAILFITSSERGNSDYLIFVPLVILVSLLCMEFPLSVAGKTINSRLCWGFSDPLIFVFASYYNPFAAIMLSGLEAVVGTRRVARRTSSTLYSGAMITLSMTAAVLPIRYLIPDWAGISGEGVLRNLLAMMVASGVYFCVNVILLALARADKSDAPPLKRLLRLYEWVLPKAVTIGATASIVHIACSIDLLGALIVGSILQSAIYLIMRQQWKQHQSHVSELNDMHGRTIEALTVAINAKDEVTHEHVLRVQIYAAGVARRLNCTEAEVEALKAGAVLHDIGKIAVPDYILNKPGKLTEREFGQMKMHTIIGARILSRVEFPYPVVPVVRHHHERWDGGGYPDGLCGEEIPITARILSIVDCFDALREDRPYRRGVSREEAVNFLKDNAGTIYDPQIVELFIEQLPQFESEMARAQKQPVINFGLDVMETLSAQGRSARPAAGLAEDEPRVAEHVATEFAATPESTHRLLESPLERRTDARLCAQLARLLSTSTTRAGAAQIIAAHLTTVLPDALIAITTKSEERGAEWRIVEVCGAAHQELRERLRGLKIKPGSGITGWVLSYGKPMLDTNPTLDMPGVYAKFVPDGMRLSVLPLADDEGVCGAIGFYSTMPQGLLNEAEGLMNEPLQLLTSFLSTFDLSHPAKQKALSVGAAALVHSTTHPVASLGEETISATTLPMHESTFETHPRDTDISH